MIKIINEEIYKKILENDQYCEQVANMLLLQDSIDVGENWKGLIATPPGSFMEDFLSDIKTHTDIPLEIPFSTIIAFISGYLLNKKIKINIKNVKKISLDRWMVCIANSGWGKTYILELFKEVFKSSIDKIKFPLDGTLTSAKFMSTLKENNNSLWFKDEFGKFIVNFNKFKNSHEIKDYLLDMYQSNVVARNTAHKDKSFSIKNPALTILGFTQPEVLYNQINNENLMDGFLQRFNYIIAERDPNRPLNKHPIYIISEKCKKKWIKKWEQIEKSIIHTEYLVSEKVQESFKTSFRMLINKKIDTSFFRRVLWESNKTALIYHIWGMRTIRTTTYAKEFYINEIIY